MDEPTESFDRLTALLKLKRCELPPPGYFDRFSAQVMARIEARPRASWLDRFWQSFEQSPALAAACGMVAGGLLVGGIMFSQGGGNSQPGAFTLGRASTVPAGLRVGQESIFEPALTAILPVPVSNRVSPEPWYSSGSLGAVRVNFER